MKNTFLHKSLSIALIVSYSVTIPVLSVLHTHEVFDGTFSSHCVEVGTSGATAKPHQPFFEICARINSAQIYADHGFQFHNELPTFSSFYSEDVDRIVCPYR